MSTESKRDEHLTKCFNLASSLLELGKDLQERFNKRRISVDRLSAEGAVICFLFAKNLTTAEVIVRLCRQRYPNDALILLRTVFEAALWVLDIFREPDTAEEKARAFLNYDFVDRKKMIKQLLEVHEQKDDVRKQLTEALEKAEQEVQRIEKELGGRKDLLNYGRKSVMKLADDAKLLSLYDTFYWKSSLYAHNRVRSSTALVAESHQSWDFACGPTEKGIDNVLMNLCHFLWYLINQFNLFFKLKQNDAISRKWQDLGDVFNSALKQR